MKKLLLLLVLVFAAGAGFVYLRLGLLAKTAIEAFGPKMLGAPVSVGLITLSPFTGEGTVRGLRVGNPEGFSKADALSLGALKVAVDVKSLAGKKLVVKSISVEKPQVLLEFSLKGTNLQKLQRNLDAFAGSGQASSGSGSGKALEIGLLSMTGGEVTVLVPALKGGPRNTPLPDIRLEGLGKGPEGVTPAEASKKILNAVTDGALKAAGPQGVQGALEKAGGILKGLFKK
jgi:hypothetical protein